jgi:membrane-associated phospholipid phosphatase
VIFGAKGSSARRALAGVLSFSILAAVFVELFRLDLPLARFVRSLHVQWLERLGDTAGILGSGAALVAFSAVLLAVGQLYQRQVARRAGMQSLVAHGIAALLAQALKHGIGRPRPRLMHADAGFGWHPSFQVGLDSFPSGHATASFAVATVLAKHFPAFAGVMYGAAGLIGVSRVARGSHYPTDVLGGICLGVIVGALVVYPPREWKRVIPDVLLMLVPYGLAAFGVLSLMLHFPPADTQSISMLWGGATLLVVGMAMRAYVAACGARDGRLRSSADRLIVVGLGAVTASWVLTALAAALCLVHDFDMTEGGEQPTPCSVSSSPTLTERLVVPLPALLALLQFDGQSAAL